MKMIYAPEGLFNVKALKPEPVEVEVLKHGEHTSRIRQPLSEDCFINIARKRYGHTPIKEMEKDVLTEYLQPIQ